MNKIKELTDEDLERVGGGWSQNEDGTYNINRGEAFRHGLRTYVVLETRFNIGANTEVYCEYSLQYSDGSLSDYKEGYYSVEEILFGL